MRSSTRSISLRIGTTSRCPNGFVSVLEEVQVVASLVDKILEKHSAVETSKNVDIDRRSNWDKKVIPKNTEATAIHLTFRKLALIVCFFVGCWLAAAFVLQRCCDIVQQQVDVECYWLLVVGRIWAILVAE